MTPYSRSETLLGTALAPMDWPRSVSLVFAFSLFNALAAQFSLNLGPIPITGQTFAVTLTGALLGSRLGALALVAYIVEGCSGLPFFANGATGLAVLIGPTDHATAGNDQWFVDALQMRDHVGEHVDSFGSRASLPS